jgi:hypothetical protein
MKGWVMAEEGGFGGHKLKTWLEQARRLAETLPKK